ncbi:MAG TPA: hypothetical protein VMR02_06900 [Terracidiphilus sp.]|nr:hypothetical protein [Terracidiphilus sp.]
MAHTTGASLVLFSAGTISCGQALVFDTSVSVFLKSIAAFTFLSSHASLASLKGMAIPYLTVAGTMAFAVFLIGITTVRLMQRSIANEAGAMGNPPSDVRVLALRAAAIAAGIMSFFELSKMVFFPSITIWASHLVTILVVALLVSIASFSVHKKQERLSGDRRECGPLQTPVRKQSGERVPNDSGRNDLGLQHLILSDVRV